MPKPPAYHSTSGGSSYKIWRASWIVFFMWMTFCVLGWIGLIFVLAVD